VMRIPRPVLAAAAFAAIAIPAAACGEASVGDVQDKLNSGVPKEIEAKNPGVKVNKDAACPKDAKVKKGQQFTCTITADDNGKKATLTLHINMTADNKFEWSFDPTTDLKE
jgi:hypothetical protein